jgi:hypothetical protein
MLNNNILLKTITPEKAQLTNYLVCVFRHFNPESVNSCSAKLLERSVLRDLLVILFNVVQVSILVV